MPRSIAYEEESQPPARRQRVVPPAAAASAPLIGAAKLPSPGDNCAIAVNSLSVGSAVLLDGTTIVMQHDLLDGHRFAVRPIAAGELLLSWGEPFGRAQRPIAAGEWVCNTKVLAQLHSRGHAAAVRHPNFIDYVKPAALDEGTFVPGTRLPLRQACTSFGGFVRGGARGVGTRNFLVILPLSSRANAFARALERKLRDQPDARPLEGAFDGVVSLPHTEDGLAMHRAHQTPAGRRPQASANHALLQRTLLGLLTHPNVGAALVLQTVEDVSMAAAAESSSSSAAAAAAAGREEKEEAAAAAGVCYATLEASAARLGLSDDLQATPHSTLTLSLVDFGADLAVGIDAARLLLPTARACVREPCAASTLVVAQQCGGSDAFSGTAANPLLADASKLLIEAGGAALLAETDELIGAEQYVLQSVRDFETARRFVKLVARFTSYAHDHHTSAEGNPSGGNMLRGEPLRDMSRQRTSRGAAHFGGGRGGGCARLLLAPLAPHRTPRFACALLPTPPSPSSPPLST